mmetsp:Transcript_30092/g.63864  ORF Transcript_30092/g.63864 Transcript_30092/m.63864 type:complete len:422 (-) Transcript_30092:235-1500(-)
MPAASRRAGRRQTSRIFQHQPRDYRHSNSAHIVPTHATQLPFLDHDPNLLVGPPRVRVQLPHPVHPRLLVGLAVVLLRRGAVVVVWHVRGGHDEVPVGPREAVRPHVVLVLGQDDGPARDEEARVVGKDRGDVVLVVASAATGPLGLPQVHVPYLELGLHVPSQQVVDPGAEDAGAAGEQRVDRVRHGEHRVWAKHVVVVHGREAVAYVVDDDLNGAGEEGMAWGGGDEAVPEAAAVADLDAGLIDGGHESDIVRDGVVQIGFEEHVHVGVDAAANEQHAVPEEIRLEGSRGDALVRLSHLRREVRAQELPGRVVVVEVVLPPALLPALDQPAHVRVFVFRHRLEPRLVHDFGHQPPDLLAVPGRTDRVSPHDRLGRRADLAEYVAVAGTLEAALRARVGGRGGHDRAVLSPLGRLVGDVL